MTINVVRRTISSGWPSADARYRSGVVGRVVAVNTGRIHALSSAAPSDTELYSSLVQSLLSSISLTKLRKPAA
jgi:hypothetical protein